jgi:XTP/dITP diphosphohydrolase
MTFIIATNNEKKLIELKRILEPLGIDVKTSSQAGINLDDVEETGKTFAENARLKAQSAAKLTKHSVIADDSGLCVDALNGAPGIYTARYSGEKATSERNIEKLLNELNGVPFDERTAHFTTSICCILNDGTEITAEGSCFGKIGLSTKGENGFGYDPVFFIDDGRSFAQLSNEEKDKISHRGNALRELQKKLKIYFKENKNVKQ